MGKALILTGITGERIGLSTTFSARINIVGQGSNAGLSLRAINSIANYAELRQILERWFVVPQVPDAQVYINGTRVTSQALIKEGDLVSFGNSTFRASFTNVQAVGENSNPAQSEGIVPRIGEYLLRKGFVTRAQIDAAVQSQNDLRRKGRRVQLGDILHTMGAVSRAQLELALQDQRGDYYEQFRD
jgi:hypothetical protein